MTSVKKKKKRKSVSSHCFHLMEIDDGPRPINQSILIKQKELIGINWYRSVLVNRRSIANHTKTVHRLLSIGTIPTQSSQRKEYTPLLVYLNYPLALVFPVDGNWWSENQSINEYQLITTWIFAINWSSILNINNWLIDIDWFWLISIVIYWKHLDILHHF